MRLNKNILAAYRQVMGQRSEIPTTNFFTLASAAKTSGGVYVNDKLVRTLWTAVHYEAGTHPIPAWDYKDDFGVDIAADNVVIKVLSHNVVGSWEGVAKACNNSEAATGTEVWAFFADISCMTPIGDKMFVGIPFSEGVHAQAAFLLNTPRRVIKFRPPAETGQASFHNCANNNYIFYAGKDYEGTGNFVFALNVSDLQLSTFTNGVSYTPPNGITYPSTLGLNTSGNAGRITGIACTEKYAYFSYEDQNLIKVYRVDDRSGSFVRDITFTAPRNVRVEGNNLFIADVTTITKYPINTDGSLGTVAITISGLNDVGGLSVMSGDLCVLDKGDQQTIKRYNSSTGDYTGMIGETGGYATSPDVTNTKFSFKAHSGIGIPYVAHENDGSIWIGDCGNHRNLHFDADGTYLGNDNSIMYIPANYYVSAIVGDENRILVDILEFLSDPSRPMATRLTLSKNWGYHYPDTFDGHSTQKDVGLFNGVAKLSNGKTYGIGNASGGYSFLFELAPTGFRTIAGSHDQVPQFSQLWTDGDMYNFQGYEPTLSYGKWAFKQFNTVGDDENPEWDLSNFITLATIQQGPIFPKNPQDRRYKTTEDGSLMVYEIGAPSDQFYSVGFFKDGEFKAGALKSTIPNYRGPFTPFAFDRYNNVWGPGSDFVAIGSFGVFVYKGEHWKSMQTSKFFLIHQCGLPIDTIGVVQAQFLDSEMPAYGYATNILCAVPYYHASTGRGWFMINSENAHCLQSWLLEGINTINLQSITVNISGTPPPIPGLPGVDLLAGTPELFATDIHITGLTRVPVSDNAYVTTSARLNQNDMSKSSDILISVNGQGNFSNKFTLPYNSLKPNWLISGKLSLEDAFIGSEGPYMKCYIAVEDNTGKTIIRIDLYQTARIGVNGEFFGPVGPRYPNSDLIIRKSGSGALWSLTVFGITYSGTASLTDPSANINAPAKINFDLDMTVVANNGEIGIVELNYNGS
ncbi:hypothetical protein [Mucilaginibacter sp. UYCu711]|uniref:hypothetical protein n=1 Tax=Mucilaginibacter sp. UYCu711 TaxID=3156339 RepID=UPI003D1B0464